MNRPEELAIVGRLGRDRVYALRQGNVDIPSDFSGVVYEAYDAGDAWKQALARELGAAEGHYPIWSEP